ncbi:MAG: hypothetical protein CMM60_06780 [Rhodospirillaceae bacterium]|jgi:LmbE family N-acetylglucosaminyl deacetylase|nr:hypothetical protein [Rhodospirillaceae bacterium]MDP6425777.1 PIG-L family deacetylase [Dehalococcoidia bacterium]|tara:strand:+ start:4611 stop:5471 length:861 start_codon:yes stop_codon:yes gene_type:complete
MLTTIKTTIKKILIGKPSKANYKFILKDWKRLFDLQLCQQILETKRFYQHLNTIQLDNPRGRRILVLAPHIDDEIFGTGGTLVKAIEKGAQIDIIYVANIFNDSEQTKRVRNEALSVCQKLGVVAHFLNCQIRNIPLNNRSVNNQLVSLVESIKPDTLFLPFLLDDHDDHRRVNHLLWKNLNTPKKNIEIWSYQIYSTVIPNVVVDITEYIQIKKELMDTYREVAGNRDWTHYIMGLNSINCRYIPGKKKTYGEAFFVVPLTEYFQLCEQYFANPSEIIYYRYDNG